MTKSATTIGIDVGGTKIAGGLVELASGRVLLRRTAPTGGDRGGEAVLADALALAAGLIADSRAHGHQPAGIGVAVCELVNHAQQVTSGHAVAWNGLPVRERFGALLPAVVEADVRAHALAEARYGAGRAMRQFAFVTVGTGISSCLVIDGRPHAGARGNALILASSPHTMRCDACGSVNRPILEEYAAGPALVARYVQAGGRAERGEEVLAAAAAGDHAAVDVVESAAEALGVALGWLANVADPEGMIVGGGLGTAGGRYWDALIAATRAHIWADDTRTLPIVMAALGADAGIVGAACAGIEN
jgi:glucokinase